MALSQIGISQTSKPQKKYESLKSWEFFLSLIFRTYKTMYLGKKGLNFVLDSIYNHLKNRIYYKIYTNILCFLNLQNRSSK